MPSPLATPLDTISNDFTPLRHPNKFCAQIAARVILVLALIVGIVPDGVFHVFLFYCTLLLLKNVVSFVEQKKRATSKKPRSARGPSLEERRFSMSIGPKLLCAFATITNKICIQNRLSRAKCIMVWYDNNNNKIRIIMGSLTHAALVSLLNIAADTSACERTRVINYREETFKIVFSNNNYLFTRFVMVAVTIY